MQTTFPDDKSGKRPAVWIDLLDPTQEEIAAAHRRCGLRIPTRGELEEIETSSRLRVDGGAIVVSMPITAPLETGHPVRYPMGFVLGREVLVTVRYSEIHGVALALEALKGETDVTSAGVFASVVEKMVDYGADMLEQFAARLNLVSRRIFDGPETRGRDTPRVNRELKATLREVGDAGERLSHVRESLLALERIVPYVAENGREWIGSAVASRLKIVEQDVKSLAEFEVHLTDKVQFLLDATIGLINTEQNDIFRVLTIVSVIGIPPTFIVGMYGMNFDTIHEYHWRYGYAWGLSLIALSIVLPIWWFKRRGWF